MAKVITVYDSEDNEIELSLPTYREVCSRCQGTGTHCNPSIDGNGISQEEFDQDPEFEENYFSGAYDVTCNECGGENVVEVVDEEKLKPEDLKAYQRWARNQEEMEREAKYQERYQY